MSYRNWAAQEESKYNKNGVTITSSAITWPDDTEIAWARPGGIAKAIVGTWKGFDSSTGNFWTFTFNANGTVSVKGVILMCNEEEWKPNNLAMIVCVQRGTV